MQILVTIPTPDDFDVRVSTVAPKARIIHARPGDAGYDEALVGSSVILGRPPADGLRRASSLDWLQLSSAGANTYVGKISDEITLTTASGVYGIPASEHVLAMMLAISRSIHKSARDQPARLWDRSGRYNELFGSTCGVLGLGDIGMAVAHRVSAFGMHVLGSRRNVESAPEGIEEVYPPDRLSEMLGRCDHVVNTLPETESTVKMLDGSLLRSMRRGSYLYNIGRGTTVDQDALVEVLRNGHLAGAGLDVFEEEPLPEESPLWRMPNVIITPHVGGMSPREDERVAEVFLENLLSYVRGDDLRNLVDHGVGY